MSLRDSFLASTWIWPTVTGRIARRVYAAIFLLLLFATASIRIYSYILTRRIQAVISGLSELHIDQTTEEELVRTVPHLAPSQWGGQVKRTAETGDIDIGAVHVYYVTINDGASWMKFGRYITPLLSCCVKVGYTKDGYERGWIFTLTELMGYR